MAGKVKYTYYYKLFRVKRSDGRVTTVSVDPVLVTKACLVLGGLKPVAKRVREAAYEFAQGGDIKSCSAFVQSRLRAVIGGSPGFSETGPTRSAVAPHPRSSRREVSAPAAVPRRRQLPDESVPLTQPSPLVAPLPPETAAPLSLEAFRFSRPDKISVHPLSENTLTGAGLLPGDLLFVQPDTFAQPGAVVMTVVQGKPTPRLLFADAQHVWWLSAATADGAPERVNGSMEVAGIVVGYYRSLPQ